MNAVRKKPPKSPLAECLDKPPGEQTRCIVEKTGNAIGSMERSIVNINDRLNGMPTLDDIKRETAAVVKSLERNNSKMDKIRGETGATLKKLDGATGELKAVTAKMDAVVEKIQAIDDRTMSMLKVMATKDDLDKRFDEIEGLLGKKQ